MPQPCSVCTHPQRKEIDLALIRGEQSDRALAKQYQLTHYALLRHSKEHLGPDLQHTQLQQRRADQIDCNTELYKCFQRISKLSDACDAWLTDPDDPNVYTLEPRATELNVIYDKWDGERWIKKRATLSELLAGIEAPSLQVRVVESKLGDPRKLLLESCGEMSQQVERVGKLFGLFNNTVDRNRLDSMRLGVKEIQRKLCEEYKRELSWTETIDEILKYNEDPSNRAYLLKLREEEEEETTASKLIM
jgi:hypothetical protein